MTATAELTDVDARFVWKPVEYITDPPGPYVQVRRDHWWQVNAKGEVAFYRAHPHHPLSPQCNTDVRIAERFVERTPGAVAVVLIPLAFTPIRIEDY